MTGRQSGVDTSWLVLYLFPFDHSLMAFGFRPGERRGIQTESIAAASASVRSVPMKKVSVEKHKTKTVIDLARGSVNIEIETLTTIVVSAAWDDDDESLACCPFAFEEAPLVPALKRLPKRS